LQTWHLEILFSKPRLLYARPATISLQFCPVFAISVETRLRFGTQGLDDRKIGRVRRSGKPPPKSARHHGHERQFSLSLAVAVFISTISIHGVQHEESFIGRVCYGADFPGDDKPSGSRGRDYVPMSREIWFDIRADRLANIVSKSQ
jgi:hypothetical protein